MFGFDTITRCLFLGFRVSPTAGLKCDDKLKHDDVVRSSTIMSKNKHILANYCASRLELIN